MGFLQDGAWVVETPEMRRQKGRFQRQDSAFRGAVTADGASGFKAEPGRYHLYVSTACPWAHRTLIMRKLKGLEDLIPISIVAPVNLDDGWEFGGGPGCIADPIGGAGYLYEIYTRAKPDYSGRVTVPVLWDKARATIVNNESSEIILMFNSAFDGIGAKPGDYAPDDLAAAMAPVNDDIYTHVNNGVYRTGFAGSQQAYEEAFDGLFACLDRLERRLSSQRYLMGARLTIADVRLFPTLVRFDAVYHGHFKCNLRRLADYAALSAYARDLYQTPGFGDTTDMDHIKTHYYASQVSINPNRIVAKGPALDFNAPHGRAAL